MPVNMVLAKTQVATISLQDCYPSYCIYSFRQAIPCGTGIEYLPLFPKLSTFANMNYAFSTFQSVCLNTKQLSSSFFFFFSLIKKYDQRICWTYAENQFLWGARETIMPSLEAIQKYTFHFEVLVLFWENIHMQLVSLNTVSFPREKDLIGFNKKPLFYIVQSFT